MAQHNEIEFEQEFAEGPRTTHQTAGVEVDLNSRSSSSASPSR
ncbi:MAG TPA: hypothetical protein PLC22_20725 [Gordonia sp. (in: high G+C Gram-positive bacteria)]|nr:hypothetical protein [Gordonia sp. (in: high G+C Gram-positive bacteria)]